MIKKFFTLKRLGKFILFGLLTLILLFAVVSGIVYFKKDNLLSKIRVEADLKDANTSFEKAARDIIFHLDGEFMLNVFNEGKPRNIKNCWKSGFK